MVVIEVLFGVVFIALAWMILMPVDLRINTETGLFEVKQLGTLSISLHPHELPFVRMSVLGVSVAFSEKTAASKRVGPKKRTAMRERKQKSVKAWLRLTRSIWNSFQCKRFICDIDFDDVVLDAQLLPFARLATHGSLVLNVNFQGRYLVDMWIRAKVYRLLWAGLRFVFTK